MSARKKTHCQNGHPRTPENVTGTNCRVCRQEQWANLPDALRRTDRRRLNTRNYRRRVAEAAAGRPAPDLCELCGKADTYGRRLAFDHCHKHGHFRGWLCSRCNLVLGKVGDDPDLLHAMIAYLERNANPN